MFTITTNKAVISFILIVYSQREMLDLQPSGIVILRIFILWLTISLSIIFIIIYVNIKRFVAFAALEVG